MEFRMEFRLQPVHGVPASAGIRGYEAFRLKAELHAELHAPERVESN
jgi:hypothetical protein